MPTDFLLRLTGWHQPAAKINIAGLSGELSLFDTAPNGSPIRAANIFAELEVIAQDSLVVIESIK